MHRIAEKVQGHVSLQDDDLEYLKRNMDIAGPDVVELMKNMPSESARMAIAVIAVAPLMLMYPFFQKYFVKGMTIGSVKG